ncbi:hypothetical protein Tco_0244329, partial [Tanacetum coccineum]
MSPVLAPSPEPPPDHRLMVVNGDDQWRSTTTGPPANGGGQRRSIGGEPPLTTAGPSVNHRSTVVDRQSVGGSRAGSSSGRGPGRVAMWHHLSRPCGTR